MHPTPSADSSRAIRSTSSRVSPPDRRPSRPTGIGPPPRYNPVGYTNAIPLQIGDFPLTTEFVHPHARGVHKQHPACCKSPIQPGRPSFCTGRVNPIARGYGRPLVGHPRPAPFAGTAPARAARTTEERSLGVGPGGCALGYLLARLAVPAFLERDRWHGPSGLIRRDRPRLAFIPRLGLQHLFLRPGRLALEGGGRRIGQIDEATGSPADAVEQLVAFLPDRLGVGLKLAHSRLRLLPQRRELFL